MISEIDLSKAIFGTASTNRFSANNAGGIKIGSSSSGSSGGSSLRYGTCKTASKDGKVTVLMDGSDEPMVVATNETLEVGDRVSLISHNGSYKAVALGNGTIGGNMVNVDEVFANKITASQAFIQNLTANTAFIQMLSSDEAFIKSLTANDAFITDLTANNAFVDKLTASDAFVTKLSANEAFAEKLTANTAFIEDLTANDAFISNIASDEILTDKLAATFVQVDQANIDEAWVDKLMVQGSFVSQNGTVYNLTGLHINAGDITTGTLTVDRIAVKSEVDGEYYMLTPNPEGGFTQVKLDGNIIQKDSINADRIIANSITTDQITTNNLVGTGGWINLANGTFKYSNATTGGYISWDGAKLEMNVDKLTVGGSAVPTNESLQDKIDDAKKYATNYLEYNSTDGLLVGNKSNGTWSGYRTKISGDGVDFLDGDNTSMSNFGSTVRVGKSDSQNVYIDSAGVQFKDGETVLSEFKGNDISLGANSENANIYMANKSLKISSSEPDQAGNLVFMIKGNSKKCRGIEIAPYNDYTGSEQHVLQIRDTYISVYNRKYGTDPAYFSHPFSYLSSDRIDLKAAVTANSNINITANSTIGLSAESISLKSGSVSVLSNFSIQNAPVNDFIIAEGTSYGWRYKKYRNGTWEAMRTGSSSANTNSQWGGVYWDSNMKGGLSWPFSISSCSVFIVSAFESNGSVWPNYLAGSDTSNTPYWYWISAGKYSMTVYYKIYAAGTY